MKKVKFPWQTEGFVWIDDIIAKSSDVEIYKLDNDYIIRIVKGRKYAGINSGIRFFEQGFYIGVEKQNIIKKSDSFSFKELTEKELPKWYKQNRKEADKESERLKREFYERK